MQIISKTEYRITKKGQVTIPLDFRKKLNLQAGDSVSFDLDKGTIKVNPSKSTLESVFGSVKPLKKKISFKEMRDIAIEEKINKFAASQ